MYYGYNYHILLCDIDNTDDDARNDVAMAMVKMIRRRRRIIIMTLIMMIMMMRSRGER